MTARLPQAPVVVLSHLTRLFAGDMIATGMSNQTSFLRPITDGRHPRRGDPPTPGSRGVDAGDIEDDREDGAIDFDVVTELTFADRHADLAGSTDVGTG